jgi:hypothetical protein
LACTRGDLPISVSALHPAKECRTGRLPGITQRDAFTHRFRFVYTRTIELRTDGSFSGAACFREGGNIRAKAARLQALGKRIQLLATTFEDEDEYEAPCGQTTPSLFPAGFFSNAR